MEKKRKLFPFFACFLFQLRIFRLSVLSLSIYPCRKEMFVWQTNASILLYASIRSIKCNRTRTIAMKSLRNLLYLVHRTNVVDSRQIKRERERKKNLSLYLSYYYAINRVRTTMSMCMWARSFALTRSSHAVSSS